MKKKYKILLLHSNKSDIILCGNKLHHYKFGIDNSLKYQKPHHLYIISDEEIKEGDWCYENNLDTKLQIYQVVIRNGKLGFFRFQNVWIPLTKQNGLKKIIATTDNSLTIDNNRNGLWTFLPKLPQSLIQQYIERYNSGNIMNEVGLKILVVTSGSNVKELQENTNYHLETNSNNEVIVVEDKLYSKEKVKILIEKALLHKDNGIIGNLLTAQGEIREANFNHWLNKNL